jgi:single-stranded-DNA-specific exonuclease
VAPRAPEGYIAQYPHLHPIIVQVLCNRDITKPKDIKDFLDGAKEPANPFALTGMPAAVTRLRQALRTGEPIIVYGDFDTDGVTATEILVQTLRALNGQVSQYIPHRVDEGYGLHKRILTKLARSGTRLVVTVDCGVRSLEEVRHANHLGLDMIITDHHSVGPQLPEALAIIDPKQPNESYPFSELAGVGVAYKVAQALLRSHKQTPVTDKYVRLEEDDLLDLVALGTVADLAPLRGENRSLVRRGLEQLKCTERPGIKALYIQAGIQADKINATTIGYTLAPRLNAAGRMAHAKLAYRLLDTMYPDEARQLAGKLDQINQERQQLTLKTQEEARSLALQAGKDVPLLFAASPDFKAGIVGLAASRLLDEFYRPAVVVEKGKRTSRGSARSIPEFHITKALDHCADLLIQHGGHAAAAGFTVDNENLEELAQRLQNMAAKELSETELTPVLNIDAEVELEQMTQELERELARLEPCGQANPQPLFLSKNVPVQRHRAVGKDGKHLKLTLGDRSKSWDGIAFRQGDWANKLPDRLDLVYHLELNEWNGRTNLQLNVQDIRPAGFDEEITHLWPQDEETNTN